MFRVWETLRMLESKIKGINREFYGFDFKV